MKKRNLFTAIFYFAMLVIVFRWLAPDSLIETTYARGLFLKIAMIQDFINGYFSLSIFMLLVFIGLLLFINYLFFTDWEQLAFTTIIKRLGMAIVIVIGLFLFCWGLNYKRLPIEKSMEFEVVPIEKTQLIEELELVTATLINCHQQNAVYILDSLDQINTNQFKYEAAALLNAIATRHGIPPRSHLTAREIKPAGLLLRFSTAGVYSPFTGECNIDSGLHPLAKPAVLLHEYGHGLGFGEEGTCTFLANIAGLQAKNPLIRYSVLLSYWKKLYFALRKMDAERATLFRSQLPQAVLDNLEAIRKQHAQFPDIMPIFRDWIYDTFLKAQGIKEGMRSYDRVINLQYSYRLANPEFESWYQRKIESK